MSNFCQNRIKQFWPRYLLLQLVTAIIVAVVAFGDFRDSWLNENGQKIVSVEAKLNTG